MTKSRRSLANSIRIVFAPLLLSLFGALPAFATDGIYSKFGLDFGYAGRIGYMGGTTPEWAIYVYGAGTAASRFNALNISSPPDDTGLQVNGNIALAGVYSALTVSGHTSINGDRYEQTTSTESINSTGTITGSPFSRATINSQLNSGVTSLKNVSIAAAGLTATAGSPTSLNIGKNQSKTFDITSSGKYVMNLSSFVMGGGTNGANGGTLTLKGAAGSAFVINVSGAFSLGSNARIVLMGGLTVSDVLFNVTGSNSTFSIGGDALFNGTLLAYNKSGAQRTLTITGHNTQINGELLANRIQLQSGAHVKKPKEKSKDDDDYAASNSMMAARTGIK
jgi:Ice-binding-like